MKKLIIGLCLLSAFAHAQDTVSIVHTRYITAFDTKLRYPLRVHWTVTTQDVCGTHDPRRVARKDSYFKADPQLKVYTDLRKNYLNNPQGYERGHNMDAADNSCDLDQMKECHYFSNITPQTKELNEQVWGDLEDHTRRMVKEHGKVEVWCGSFGVKEMMGPVSVPKFCWKIIRYDGVEEAYIMPNEHSVNQHNYDFYQTTVADVR